MKKIVCDICRGDIKYDGVRFRLCGIFGYFLSVFKRAIPIPKRGSDRIRVDICDNCFGKLCNYIRNPNTIQDLRSHMTRNRIERVQVMDEGGQTAMPEDVLIPTPMCTTGRSQGGN